jgi:hypothetical protein
VGQPSASGVRFIHNKIADIVASDWWLTAREYLQDYNARVQTAILTSNHCSQVSARTAWPSSTRTISRPLADLMKDARITSQEAHALFDATVDVDRVRFLPSNPQSRCGRRVGHVANEARRIIRDFENEPRGDAFRDLADYAGDIRNFIKAEMLHGHLESAETISQGRRDGPNYVPAPRPSRYIAPMFDCGRISPRPEWLNCVRALP